MPFARPSSAPLEVMDTEDTINPRLMIRSAVLPAVIVCGLVVNSPSKVPGINMQSRVPVSMIPAERYNV